MFAAESLAAPTVLREPEHLHGKMTRYYSHVHWQKQPGNPIRVRLLPGVNYTGKSGFDINALSGKEHNTEVRTIPSTLEHLYAQLINNSNILKVDNNQFEYYFQIHIQDYNTLYAPSDSNDLLSLWFAHIDRAWSMMSYDDTPGYSAISLVLYNKELEPVLEIPVMSHMYPCERASKPMTFSPGQYQAFFDGLATTATGQSLISAVNRGLVEVAAFFKNRSVRGQILRVDNQDIFINIGMGQLYKNERVKLMYKDDPVLPAYAVGELQVEEVYDDYALAYAVDVRASNVVAGDEVVLNKIIKKRQFVSVAGKPIRCKNPDTREQRHLAKPKQQDTANNYGFQWQLPDQEH
ncbi:hypothetical protein [Pleionea sp. CnH1-48]|uniref:hypothetical protein n=1 Tax=Pleionea sp. CnH1-48 TaxID=2954494 RepID=UPI0020975C14|nr:hypothetical protein [Pleionea sp. CnH1-48]MCO7224081.1 hypothetical protein [Pleionea sp. CnH1-48]